VPTLAAVLVGNDPASEVYVRNKVTGCEQVGMQSRLHRLPAETSQDDLLALIAKLNKAKDEPVHGILVQLPLPKHIDVTRILHAVSPLKDVDGFHPENVGCLVQGHPRFLPCTPSGIQQLLVRNQIEIAGRHVVVVGRSETVGKPMALMLMQRGPGGDATVTVCHSKTRNLPEITRQADILIVAIGHPQFITAEMVKPGAVVIDVGIHRTPQGLVGDVDFAAVSQVASHISPVPGGVGPLTVTMLLVNTLAAARQQH
jgi:methylenetetrahydrofolate dehydrogenase (NADP+)/methenyltetrahydrofolate cyclohydrolase